MNFWLKSDLSDLLDSLRSAREVDDTLVNAELEVVICFGTVATWSTASGNPKAAAWHWDWPTYWKVVLLQLADEVSADTLKVWKLGRCDGKTDFLDWKILKSLLLLITCWYDAWVSHSKGKPNRPFNQCKLINFFQYGQFPEGKK